MRSRAVQVQRPKTLSDAALLARDSDSVVISGGCESRTATRREAASLILLSRIEGLDRLEAHPKKGLTIGALTRLNAVAGNLWVAKRWAALHEAIEHMLPPQIRNMSTVVGNICAAKRDYDLATTLMALRADVHFATPDHGAQFVSVTALYDQDGELALPLGSVVSHLFVGAPSPDAGSAFRKLRLSRNPCARVQKINVASYIALDPDGETIVEATLAVGGCTPAPRRCLDAEQWLTGKSVSAKAFASAGEMVVKSIGDHVENSVLDGDHRDLLYVLARDVLEQAASRARSKHNPFDDAQHLL